MRKMKGIVAAMKYSPYGVYEDQRARFRHQSLMQDFEDLYKETEAMGKKLQMMKARKLTLLAEVGFLKRRHKFLMQNRSSNTVPVRNFVQPQNAVVRSKSYVKGKKSTGKEHSFRCLATGFDLNRKGKTCNERETPLIHHSQMFDLNQRKHKKISRKEEVVLRGSSPILDLNQRERLYSGKEATTRTMTPVFDLNQISREEEELQAMDNSMRIEEEFKKSSIRIASDEQHHDIKISACRNTGNGPNRVGKRKITWQDQVALSV